MKRLLIALVILFPAIALAQTSIPTLNPWAISGGYLTPRVTANGVKVPALANLTCIGTDGSGIFGAGVCAGGSLSGGTAGMLTSWVTSSTVTATSTPTAARYIATSTLASQFPYASSTAFSATTLCLTGDCRSAWPTGGGGNIATGTASTAGQVLFWGDTNTTPAHIDGSPNLTFDGSTLNVGGGSGTVNADSIVGGSVTTGVFKGLIATDQFGTLYATSTPTAAYFISTSTLKASTFPYASSTALSATTLCLTVDTCRTTWPTGGSGVWPFTTGLTNFGTAVQATTTPEWFQQGVYASSTSQFGDVNISGGATSTSLGISGLSGAGNNVLIIRNAGNVDKIGLPISTSNGGTGTTTWLTNSLPYYNGTRLTEANSSLNFNGSLFTTTNASTTNLTTSNGLWLSSLGTPAGSIIAVDPTGKIIATTTSAGGVTSVTGTYPVQSTGGNTPAISLAFGTTTSNTFAGTQTFNNVTVNGTCTGCGSGSSAWPWTLVTNFGTTTNATTTGTWFQKGFYASSTSQIQYASTTAVSANNLYSSAAGGLIFGSDQIYDDGSQLVINRGGDLLKLGTNPSSYIRSTFTGTAAQSVYSSTGMNSGGGMYFPTADSVGFTLGGVKRLEIGIGSTTVWGNLHLAATSSVLLAADDQGNIIATSTPTVAAIIATSSATSTFAGPVVIGQSSPSITPENKFSVIGNANDYHGIFVQNLNNGSTASTDIVVGNDNLDLNAYADFGANSTGNTNPAFTLFGRGDAYLFNNTGLGNLVIANASSTKSIIFGTGGLLSANERMRIDPTGRIGIGTTTPWAKLSLSLNSTDTNKYAFVIASSTPTATTTLFSVDNTGVGSLSVGSTTQTISAVTGLLTLGNTSNGTSTISMGKVQIDGYNTAGTRICMFVVGTTLTIGSGACTP